LMARRPRRSMAVLTRLLRPVPVERAAVLAAVKTKPSAAQVGRS
jgi:hypothetical protein